MWMYGAILFSHVQASSNKENFVGPDNLAIPTVRLAPPKNPLPQVSAAIREYEASRESLEQEKLAQLHDAYSDSLEHVRNQVSKFTSHLRKQFRASSFLEFSGTSPVGDSNVVVKVIPSRPVSQKAKIALDRLEGARSIAEGAFLDQAVAELRELGNIITDIFGQEVSRHINSSSFLLMRRKSPGGFLQVREFPKQASVRVGTSGAYPTVGDFAEALEARRDASETQARAEILRLQAQLLKESNDIIRETLVQAVGRIAA